MKDKKCVVVLYESGSTKGYVTMGGYFSYMDLFKSAEQWIKESDLVKENDGHFAITNVIKI